MNRRLLPLLFLLLLGACAPRFEGRGPLSHHPRLLPDDYIQVQDGERLHVQSWRADHPKAIVIGVHGFNDYAETFYLAGPWFRDRGVSLIAYDQRGFGHSASFGHWPGRQALQADLTDTISAVRQAYPDLPIFLMGVSMGGAVVLTRAEEGLSDVAGQILVGPGVWGWQTLNPLYAFTLSVSARLFPSMTVTGKGLGILPSDNMDMLRKIARDPLMVRETHTDAIYGLVDLMDEAFTRGATIRAPSLLLYGRNDRIIPQHAMKAFRETLPPGVDVREYDTGYHMLLRDLQAERVWQDILDWIEEKRLSR